MSHRARSVAVVALLCASGLAPIGCVTEQGQLQVAATRPVELNLREVDLDAVSIRRGVRGSDTMVTSVLFLPTGESPRLENAVENALVEHGGDVMTRAHVRTIDWWFLIGVTTLEVRGDVVDLVDTD